jgi:hypothetical protein
VLAHGDLLWTVTPLMQAALPTFKLEMAGSFARTLAGVAGATLTNDSEL